MVDFSRGELVEISDAISTALDVGVDRDLCHRPPSVTTPFFRQPGLPYFVEQVGVSLKHLEQLHQRQGRFGLAVFVP